METYKKIILEKSFQKRKDLFTVVYNDYEEEIAILKSLKDKN